MGSGGVSEVPPLQGAGKLRAARDGHRGRVTLMCKQKTYTARAFIIQGTDHARIGTKKNMKTTFVCLIGSDGCMKPAL